MHVRQGEPDAVLVDRLCRRFNGATDAFDQCERDHRFSPAADRALLTYRVIASTRISGW